MSPYVGFEIISYDESAPKIQQKIQVFAQENFFIEYQLGLSNIRSGKKLGGSFYTLILTIEYHSIYIVLSKSKQTMMGCIKMFPVVIYCQASYNLPNTLLQVSLLNAYYCL